MENQDWHGFEVGLEIHICFRGAKTDRTQEWTILPGLLCGGSCLAQVGICMGKAQGVGTDWP